MISEDLIKGAKNAAEYLGPNINARTVYHLVEAQRLPVIRMGRSMYFRKSELDAAFRSAAGNA